MVIISKLKSLVKFCIRISKLDLEAQLVYILRRNYILIYAYIEKNGNFGDDLNVWILKRITNKTIINSSRIFNYRNEVVNLFIGSVIGYNMHGKVAIFGAGSMHSNDVYSYKSAKVYSVRGPLTFRLLNNNGIYCPPIYADPALLLPLIHKVEKIVKYRIGIIPHYIDKNTKVMEVICSLQNDDILVIDIQASITKVIDMINSCDRIISSSLHGIIVADAYGIPSKWVKFSNNVVGEGFKFLDYFASVDRNDITAPMITKQNFIEIIDTIFLNYGIPVINIRSYINNLPDFCNKEFLSYALNLIESSKI